MAYEKLTAANRKYRAEMLRAQREERFLRGQSPRVAQLLAKNPSTAGEQKKESNGFVKGLHTAGDLGANVLIGAGKGVEGIVDLLAGVGGAVAGIFSDEAENAVKQFVAKDITGELYGNAWQEGLDQSLLNGSKVGQIVEGVAQGVGQLLPAVAVSVATGGAALPSLVTTMVSAAGTGTESAFQEGAGYGQGLAYGAASGAVEGVTEKLTGGLGGLFGDGMKITGKTAKKVGQEVAEAGAKTAAKTIGKETAKVGAKRVAVEALGEGVEEMISEAANPALKSIYKGKDAYEEYGDEEFWGGVLEAGVIGMGTSAAYGGTVGRALKTTGVYGDANSVASHIEEQKKLRSQKGLSQADKVQIEKNIKADQELLSKRLQKLSDKKRAKVLEKVPTFRAMFEADGTIKAEQMAALDANIRAAGDTTYDSRYRSSTLGADTIKQVLENGSKNGAIVTAYTGEVEAEQQAALDDIGEIAGAVSERSGGAMGGYVVAQNIPGGKSYIDTKSRVMVISIEDVKQGKVTSEYARNIIADTYVGDMTHEWAHGIEQTNSGKTLAKELTAREELHDLAIKDVLERGYMKEFFGKKATAKQVSDRLKRIIAKENAGKTLTAKEQEALSTYRSEVFAFASQRLLGTESFMKKLITTEPSVAERVIGKIRELTENFKARTSPDAKKALAELRRAEKLYLQGLSEVGGTIDAKGKIHIANREDEENGEGAKEILDAAPAVRYNRRTSVDEKAGTDYLIRNFSGEVKYDSEALSLSKEELAVISQAVKTGWGKLDAQRKYGRVHSAMYYYPFVFNSDGSITVTQALHIDAEKDAIEIKERVLNHGASKSRKVGNFSDWAKLVRDEWGGHSFNAGDGDGQFQSNRSPASMDGDARRSVTGADLGRRGADRPNGQVSFRRSGKKATLSEDQYADFGWVRENDILTNGEWEDFTSKFAGVLSGSVYAPQTKSGEYMIAVSDIDDKVHYGVNNIIVYAKGSIESPRVTRVLEIDLDNETDLDRKRREIYALERRGIQQKAGGIRRLHIASDYGSRYDGQRTGRPSIENSSQLGANRGAGGGGAAETAGRNVTLRRSGEKATLTLHGETLNSIGKPTYFEDVTGSRRTVWCFGPNRYCVENARGDTEAYYATAEAAMEAENESLIRGYAKATGQGVGTVKHLLEEDSELLYRAAENDVRFSRKATGEVVTLSKGQYAALRANYEGDKVFIKKEVAAAVKTIDALQKLPAQMRNALVNKLWRGYNDRLNAQGFDMFTEIMWHQIHAEILQETSFEMTEDEIRAMDEQIVAALHAIVKSGKPSIKAKLESATSTEGYRKQAQYWRDEHARAVEGNKLRNDLKYELEKLANQKKGLYVNAANYRGNSFKVAIDELAKMNWRGGLVNATKIREHFAALDAWYSKDNPLYKGSNGNNELFRPEISEALHDLGNSQNGALTTEDLLSARTVVQYFIHEIEAHNTIFKDGKRVDAMPEAKKYVDKVRRAKEISVKCGIWSGLMRSKFARMVADPAMLMRQADGYLNGFFTEQYEALRQGTIDASVKERELSEEFEKFWEEHKAYGKRYNDATVKLGDVDVPLQEAMSLYMTMHREHAFAGLAGAGFEIDGKNATENVSDGFADEVQKQIAADLKELSPEELLTLTKKRNAQIERDAVRKVIEAKRKALYDQFTAEDKALISIMERGYEACREIKVRIDGIVQGYSNVTNGYYYPIRRTGLAENVDAYTGFEGDRVSNLSMNKETVKNAHKLYIEPAHIVFMRHLKATSLYHGLGVFTDNFNRLYNLNITEPQIKNAAQSAAGGKNARLSQSDLEAYMRVGKTLHTRNKKQRMLEAGKTPILTSEAQIREFLSNVINGNALGEVRAFGKVGGGLAEIVKKVRPALQIKDYYLELNADDLREAYKRHSSPKEKGDISLTDEDFLHIPDFLDQIDGVTSINTYNGKTEIHLYKKSEKGYYRILTVVSGERGSLQVAKLIGVSKEKFDEKFGKKTERDTGSPRGQTADADASNPSTKARHTAGALSSTIIHQTDPSVNTADMKNVRGPKTVRDALGQSNNFMKEMVNYFKELKQDVEGISKKRSQERAYNDAVAFIRSMYATYQLGANPKVWVTQLSSLIAATNILDADCLAKGLSVSGKDVDEYCRLAWLRNKDSSAALAQSVTTGQNAVARAGRNVLQKIRDVAMLPISKVDRLAITRLFGACQVQVEKKGGAKIGTKENKIEAGKLLQRVILETQQNSLATERSAAMRSGDELLKGFTMFSADAMKVGARFVDAFGELSALRTLRREAKKAGDSKAAAALETEIKRAKKQCVRATVSLVGVALFNAMLAYGFKWLYRRDEEESIGTVIADTFGNMLGGIPFVRDLWSFFQDGFEMDHFLISTVNDVLGTAAASFELVRDAASGKEVTRQQVLANLRKVAYAAGQLSGVPVRNLYNFTSGMVNRVSPEAGYTIESYFYKQSYRSDLEKAIEAGDDKMVATIAGLMIDEEVGIEDAGTRKVLRELTEKGYSVLPRSVGDSVTLNGEKITLTGAQQKRFRTVYEVGEEALADMVKLKQFQTADAEVQEKAIKFVYDVYWDLALEDVLGAGTGTEKNVLFAEAISIEKLAIIIATARAIEADKDKNGKAIAGTKKRKVQRFINSLHLTAAEKYMVMGYLGYTNINGEEQVKAHIGKLKLSQSEKKQLLKYSGYSA